MIYFNQKIDPYLKSVSDSLHVGLLSRNAKNYKINVNTHLFKIIHPVSTSRKN